MVQKLKSGCRVVGLTGTYGSGKSTAANLFRDLGAFVVDADNLAHEALIPGSPVYADIQKLFESLDVETDGRLDRRKMAAFVFDDAELRERLEKIIHPFVFGRIGEEVAQAKTPCIIVEVPLLFESGFDRFCDAVVVVSAPEAVIEKRMRERGMTPENVRKRQQAQMPLEEKRQKADFVIDNSEDFQKTRREVESIWKSMLAASKGV